MSKKKKKRMGKHDPSMDLIENEDAVANGEEVKEETSKPEEAKTEKVEKTEKAEAAAEEAKEKKMLPK